MIRMHELTMDGEQHLYTTQRLPFYPSPPLWWRVCYPPLKVYGTVWVVHLIPIRVLVRGESRSPVTWVQAFGDMGPTLGKK